MKRVLLAFALLLLLAPSAHAASTRPDKRVQPPVIGIADQKPEMFTDRLFGELGVKQARFVMPWDAMDGGFQKQELFTWMNAAKAAGVRPLLSFGHSRRQGREKLRPTPAQFQREFRRFRVNFPWVTEFVTWNEPNHCSQPLCNRPELAARYFDAITRACPTCTILGGEVLDQPNMASWIKRFRKAGKHEPKAWGLHNYIDANRFETKGTRALLKATKGEVWFTETGGIVNRTKKVRIPLPESPKHAAQATRWLFDMLVPLSPRIRRVYLYHWNSSSTSDTWDSALIDARGTPREAFRVVLARVLAAARARGVAPSR